MNDNDKQVEIIIIGLLIAALMSICINELVGAFILLSFVIVYKIVLLVVMLKDGN